MAEVDLDERLGLDIFPGSGTELRLEPNFENSNPHKNRWL
jgi:hypothetical protein